MIPASHKFSLYSTLKTKKVVVVNIEVNMSWECCIMHFSHVLSMKNEENALKYSFELEKTVV